MPDFYKSEAFSYPVPDPFWDYCVTWHELQEVKQMMDKLTEDMVFQQKSNEHFDRHLTRTVERMREQLKNLADNNATAYIDVDELEHISAQEIQ